MEPDTNSGSNSQEIKPPGRKRSRQNICIEVKSLSVLPHIS